MLERSHIEQLLRINGAGISSPDEEIRSVLLGARWHQKDVETALLVLRENTKSHETHVDSLHKIFRTDDHLRPETISSLLGIDVAIPRSQVTKNVAKRQRNLTTAQVIQISLLSLCFAALFVFGSMYYLHMGLFHISMR